MISFTAKVNWKHGLKTTIAAFLCLVLARAFGLSQGYWACISAIVVVQSGTTETLGVALNRIVGTAVGVLVGWGAATFWHGQAPVYAAAILACMIFPEVLGLKSAGRFAGVAASIVMLIPNDLPYWKVAEGRFFEVSLGVVVALVVSQTLWRRSPDT